MDYQNFDNQFHQRLFNAEVAPPTQVWEGVERELKQRRRRWIFGWFSASCLAVTSLAAVYFFMKNTDHAATSAAVDFQKNEMPAASAPAAPQPATDANVLTAATDAAPTSDAADVFSSEKKELTARSGRLARQSSVGKLEGGKFVNQPEVAENQYFTTEKTPQQPTPTDNFKIEKTQSNSLKTAELLPTQLSEIAAAAEPPAVYFAPIKPLWRKKKDGKHCYDFTKFGPAWLLEGYTGYAFADRSLRASEASFAAHRDYRNAHEINDFGMTGGLRAALAWGPFLFRTGLHYTQFTETFRHEQLNFIRTIIDSVPVNGGWEKRTQKIYGTQIIEQYNQFGLLDIPLTAGAEMRLGRAGLSLHGGAAINLLFWKKGQLPNSNTTDGAPTFTPMEPFFKTNAGVSLVGSGQVFYHLAPRTRVFVEPAYQRVLKPLTVGSAPISQRYSLFSLNAGVTRILD